jgi:hypothetical protein
MGRQVEAARVLAVAFGNPGLPFLRVLGSQRRFLLHLLRGDARLAIEELELLVAELLALGSVLLQLQEANVLTQQPDFCRQPILLTPFHGDESLDKLASLGRKICKSECHPLNELNLHE